MTNQKIKPCPNCGSIDIVCMDCEYDAVDCRCDWCEAMCSDCGIRLHEKCSKLVM